MRILLVNYEYPPVGGGAAVATAAIGRELTRLGHEAVVLTGRYKDLPGLDKEDGVIVRRIPTLRMAVDRSNVLEMMSFLLAGLIYAPGIIKEHRIEAAIIFFSLPCGPIGLAGKWRCGVPYVVSLRGGDVPGTEASLRLVHRALAPIRRAVLKNGIAIVANSEGLRKMAEAADPFPVQLIGNGVASDFFIPAQPGPARDLNVLRILFVGRFQTQKNVSLLLEQAAQLSPGTFDLHLVGDGPQTKRLVQLASRLGIARVIAWHGWLSGKALLAAYQWADCLVNPSLYEGMPNVVLEAMACGLPVVASNVPGNDSLVANDQTGFLFELNRPGELGSALMQLRDGALRQRLGESARKRALQFSWRNVALQYLDLLSAK